MIKDSAKYAAGFTDPTSTSGLQFDDLVGVVQPAHSGVDVPPANGDSINNTDHPVSNTDHSIDNPDHLVGIADFSAIEDSANASGDNADHPVSNTDHSIDNPDHLVGIADFFASEDSANASGSNADHSAIENSASASDGVHSVDQQNLDISSAADFADVPGTSQGLIAETQYTSFNNSQNNDHLSAVFDHIDNFNFDHTGNLTDGFANSTVADVFSTPSGHSLDLPVANPVGLPDVISDAKGGGHGGGGTGGGTTPTPYTTNSGTDVNIHVTYDSSVGNAPAGFTSDVQKVADFYASAFQDSTPITINIDVGYGEVDGMRLGIGALGESVTNLQTVSYSNLTSAYSTSGLSLGSSVPAGNLYVSYAEAKALNITITSPATVDGYVGFSSQSGIFDYNNADGVSSNQYDFYGTVAHEFSEVMGRILLVGGTINNAPSYTAFDFFHFSSPGVQDFKGNVGYFSIDQGTTNLASFNNPSNGGDAGDWANSGTSNSGGSVYDAFNAFGATGHVEPVSNTDLLALHALGYHMLA